MWILVCLIATAVAVAAWRAAGIVARRMRPYLPVARTVPPTPVDPLLKLSVCELHRRLVRGELSSVALVGAYIEHCKKVNPYVRAIVEERYGTAMAEAAQADGELARLRATTSTADLLFSPDSDGPLPPRWLLGVPCTVKECFKVTGMKQTAGLLSRRDFVAQEDAPIVARLRAAGVVVIATTNVPEICMWYETFNKIYGTTCNPYDLRRIVGGSSGGEGAAAAAMMSPFGVGSDIGGSIRMPAFFNGIVGLKPSTRLIPNHGQYPEAKTQGHFMLGAGPLCRFTEDVYPLIRTLAEGGNMLDPAVFAPCAIPRAPATVPRRLRVVLIEDLGFRFRREPSVDQGRSVHAVGDALRSFADGITVEVLNFRTPARSSGPHSAELLQSWAPMRDPLPLWTSRSADPTEMKFVDATSYGLNGRISPIAELAKFPWGRSAFTLPVISLIIAEYIEEKLPKASVKATLERLCTDMWKFLGDDGVIVAPTFPFLSPKHFEPQYDPRRWFDWLYTALFNTTQGPAMSIPVWPREREDGPYRHLPCGVQIVGAWGQDRLVMAAAQHVERTIGGYRPPPWAS